MTDLPPSKFPAKSIGQRDDDSSLPSNLCVECPNDAIFKWICVAAHFEVAEIPDNYRIAWHFVCRSGNCHGYTARPNGHYFLQFISRSCPMWLIRWFVLHSGRKYNYRTPPEDGRRSFLLKCWWVSFPDFPLTTTAWMQRYCKLIWKFLLSYSFQGSFEFNFRLKFVWWICPLGFDLDRHYSTMQFLLY